MQWEYFVDITSGEFRSVIQFNRTPENCLTGIYYFGGAARLWQVVLNQARKARG
jgi:hypothetical protein